MTSIPLPIALLLSALATGPAAPADSSQASLAWPADSSGIAHIAGTDRPLRIWKMGGDYELDFRKYRVRVTEGRGAAGETIRVVRLQGASQSASSPPTAAPLVAVAEEHAWFWGVAGDLLFIDVGCCPFPRGLVVYDLARQTRCFKSSWMNWRQDPTLREGRWFSYTEVIENPRKKPDCGKQDELKEWIQQGGDIGYEEDVILDLKTLRVTRSGKIRCGPRQ